jgi:hypothetical protein
MGPAGGACLSLPTVASGARASAFPPPPVVSAAALPIVAAATPRASAIQAHRGQAGRIERCVSRRWEPEPAVLSESSWPSLASPHPPEAAFCTPGAPVNAGSVGSEAIMWVFALTMVGPSIGSTEDDIEAVNTDGGCDIA